MGLALSKYGKGPGAGVLMGDADLIPGHSAVLRRFKELELLSLGFTRSNSYLFSHKIHLKRLFSYVHFAATCINKKYFVDRKYPRELRSPCLLVASIFGIIFAITRAITRVSSQSAGVLLYHGGALANC
jgi:hypothetical protein